jgi:hypothetical protein
LIEKIDTYVLRGWFLALSDNTHREKGAASFFKEGGGALNRVHKNTLKIIKNKKLGRITNLQKGKVTFDVRRSKRVNIPHKKYFCVWEEKGWKAKNTQ